MSQTYCKTQLDNPNLSLYSDELWEEAKGQCSFFRTSQAAVFTRFICGLSAISTFLILFLILKSSTRLSSIYHRIMFVMSACQMINSISVGLTTLPMPAPGDYWTDILNIQGTRLGNTLTCTVQGFVVRFSDESSDSYFLIGLSFYYVCAIGFEMEIETLTKYIEPLIHIACISVGLLTSLPPLFDGGYNVTYDTPFCTVAPKPWFCDSSNSTVSCVRGGVEMGSQLLTDERIAQYYDPPMTVFMILCLVIVCCRVYQKDREMATLLRDWDIYHVGRSNLRNLHGKPGISIRLRLGVYRLSNGEIVSFEEIQQQIKDQYKDTKVIVSQSALYFSVQTFLEASEIGFAFSTDPLVLKLAAFVWLMQGFYMLLFFIFHKVFNQRRHDPNISFLHALIEIFEGGPGDEAFIISGIHAVETINRVMEPSNIHESIQSGSLGNQSESTPLVPSCRLLANFRSLSMPTTTKRSLVATSLPREDDNESSSSISSQMAQHHFNANDEISSMNSCLRENNDEFSRLSEDSKGLSGFTDEFEEDGYQQSVAGLNEEVISD